MRISDLLIKTITSDVYMMTLARHDEIGGWDCSGSVELRVRVRLIRVLHAKCSMPLMGNAILTLTLTLIGGEAVQ